MTPAQARLHRADGRDVRVLHANAVDAFSVYRLSTPEFVQVKTRDGFTMEAMMIKPPDFDPRRKYPVYQFTYGGPHAQQVRNSWTLQTMYHQLLAQKGVIVWICDNRSASGKGIESTSAVYHHFGDPPAMNASIRASLKPGGRLAIIDFTPPRGKNGESGENVPGRRAEDQHHGVTAATVARELEAAGFEILSSTESGTRGVLVVARRPPA